MDFQVLSKEVYGDGRFARGEEEKMIFLLTENRVLNEKMVVFNIKTLGSNWKYKVGVEVFYEMIKLVINLEM